MAKLAARWTQLASSARLQRSSQCLSTIGSRAWIFGGELQPREPVDSHFDVIDLGEGKATSGFIPSPRVGSTTTALNGMIYMFSGRGGLAMLPVEEKGALWRYDPGQSTWETIHPADPTARYPPGRSYHAMATDGVENIYIHAGCPEKGRLGDLWSFNISSCTWTELEAAPGPARGGTSIAAQRGRLYRMNGFDGVSEQGGAVDIYDIGSRSWSTVTFSPDGVNAPSPRSVSVLLALEAGGKDYLLTLFGERDPSSLGHAGAGKMLGDAWALELRSMEWLQLEASGDLPPPRGWFDADIVREHPERQVVIVHGGLAEDNSRLGDVWKLEFV
ncbi:kelch repeat protein [Thozetella sp. PMI_491]|nr:kelch repeat protein [Thozetella sp. PMI_491]